MILLVQTATIHLKELVLSVPLDVALALIQAQIPALPVSLSISLFQPMSVLPVILSATSALPQGTAHVRLVQVMLFLWRTLL